VQVGLDRLDGPDGAHLRGKRLGLVAHAASVTADGRHATQVFRGLKLDLRRLFAPEHGLLGQAAAGEAVVDGRDLASGLPVVSLYGADRKPKARDLADLDALVVDLQDAGVRFYTYVSTALLCLEAAAEANVEVVVLDRPNPLGGERVEGPTREDGMPPSFLSLAPGPLVHGLTLGEMLRFANLRRTKPARLRVVPMSGWARRMRWDDTGRAWVAPSPNLRTSEAALAYPGTCLLEGTNVSEGRGTTAPFLLLGAPWVDGASVASEVVAEGYRLAAEAFMPEPSPGAPEPKHAGVRCGGVRVTVADAARTRPYRLGLSLLSALRKRPEFRWRDEGRALDTLLGSRRPRAALERGDDVSAIEAEDAPGIAAFVEARRKALLYP